MKMEIADVRVTLGGEVESMKVDKKNISVAEAMTLAVIHGANSVHTIRNIRTANVSAVSHKRYLSETYMRRSGDESKRDVANLLFPGMAPNFPSTFEESGLLMEQQETEVIDEGGSGIKEIETGVSADDGTETDTQAGNEDLPPTKPVGGKPTPAERRAAGERALSAALSAEA